MRRDIHIYKQVPCIILFIISIDILITTFLKIFGRFLTTFQRFSKILQKLSEGHANVSKQFLKISEDYQMFLKILPKTSEEDLKIHTPTNLNTVGRVINIFTNRVWKVRHPSPGCVFV